MRVAQYKGKSFISRAIRWLTRSEYSHTALLFDSHASDAVGRLIKRGADLGELAHWSPGSVIEAWNDPSAVRNTISISEGHDRETPVDIFRFAVPLTDEEEERLIMALVGELGWPYDWKGVFRFITRRPGNLDKAWFCSELAFWAIQKAGRTLLHNTEAWEVPPDWIPRSPKLIFDTNYVT